MASNQLDARGVQTVGAVAVTVLTMPVPSLVVGFVKGWVIGRDDLGNGCAFEVGAVGRTDGAGTVTPIGAFGTIFTRADAGLAGASVSMTVAANALNVRVTGVAGRTITWSALLELYVSG